MMKATCIAVALCLAVAVLAKDPATSWLSYGMYTTPSSTDHITFVNTSFVVPPMPASKGGSNAPGWWYSVESSDNMYLIQPILAYGNGADVFTIFNGVFNWHTGQMWESKAIEVKPGQTISSSLTYIASSDSYSMFIGIVGGQGVTSVVSAMGNTFPYSYFVLEHQPVTCRAYPPSNKFLFSGIYMEVNGTAVVPDWQALQEQPACSSKVTVVSPSVLEVTWSS